MRKLAALFAVVAVAFTMAAPGPVTAETVDASALRPHAERISGSVSADVLSDPDEIVDVFIQLSEPSVAEFKALTGASPSQQQAQGDRILDQQSALRGALADLVVDVESSLVVGANGFRASVRSGDIPAIREVDGVDTVGPVALHRPLNDSSVPAIGADAVSAAGHTGDGTVIAVIDTGVDYTHAALGGTGDPSHYASNDPSDDSDAPFPTAKVVGGHDFAGPTYDASSDLSAENTPQPDGDPLDVDGHGTHVAASAAGVDPAGPLGGGVAPDAEVLAIKVFGDVAGSTDLTADGIEYALDPNGDLSMADAADIINMSLGSDFGHPDDPSAIATQNAVDNGVVVVVASGNAGSVPYVTGSPSIAPGAISVAASVDAGVTVLGVEVEAPDSIAGTFEAQPGDFGSLEAPGVTAEVDIADPFSACDPLENDGENDLSGRIALIVRGECSFSLKVLNAQNAGAVGVVVVNDTDGEPIGMAHDPTYAQATIPAVMVSQADGETIQDAASGTAVTITLSDAVQIAKPDLADTMAGFSSRGPGQGNTFKPEVSAPGFSIFSADVGTGDGGTLSSGTSMATPHVAGVAAQLIERYPDLGPAEIKSLILNSARPAAATSSTEVPLALQGTGVVQADRAALHLGGYTSPAAVSFGRIEATEPLTLSRTIDITRLTGNATYHVEVVPNRQVAGVTWSVSSDSVTTSSGDGLVEVSISVDPAAMTADDGAFSQREADGWIRLTNNADPEDTMVVGLIAVVDPASSIEAAGGTGAVTLDNRGPAAGYADGYTLATADGTGVFGALGFRTDTVVPDSGAAYTYLEFGLALSSPWTSLSGSEVDLYLDTDEDGTDDYAIVAADLGYLLGDVDPDGQVVTALVDLGAGTATLLYHAVADNNDRVAILPADVTGDFGFLAEGDTDFDVTAVFVDQIGVAGVSETVSIDLGDDLVPGASASPRVAAGGSADVDVAGEGEMLWLYQSNPVSAQYSVVDVAAVPTVTPGDVMFGDVPDDHLFNQEIEWLADQGITKGCNPPDNDRFCPDDPVSRGQMAAFLDRSLDLAPTAEHFFVDDDDSVFEGDIDRLAAAGITRGCNPPADDRFCPERQLTRAEMATFMMRGFGFADGAGEDLFVDDDTDIHEAAIDVLGTAGVTRGCNPPVNDQYCPHRLITRGEMAAFIYRAYEAADLEG